ncbi:MAG: hypothetical protein AAFY65_08905 [Pseudomonadota bacterium]
MTLTLKSALMVAALSAPLLVGFVPAASASESADQATEELITTKSDRGGHSAAALAILASIAAEQDD